VTLEAVKALADSELAQVEVWVQQERKARAERKKQETIARIKQLAGSIGVRVSVEGVRGRPTKARPGAKPEKAAR
jgi:hypothetical protein